MTPKVIFEQYIHNSPGREIMYKVLANGSEVVNEWEAGDGTNSAGTDHDVEWYIERGTFGAEFRAREIESLRREYRSQHELPPTPPAVTLEPDPMLEMLAQANSMFLFYELGLAVNTDGSGLASLTYKNANREGRHWEAFNLAIAFDGVILPHNSKDPYKVKSMSDECKHYSVRCKGVNGSRWNECQCRDYRNRAKGGWCKHVCAVFMRYQLTLLLRQDFRQPIGA